MVRDTKEHSPEDVLEILKGIKQHPGMYGFHNESLTAHHLDLFMFGLCIGFPWMRQFGLAISKHKKTYPAFLPDKIPWNEGIDFAIQMIEEDIENLKISPPAKIIESLTQRKTMAAKKPRAKKKQSPKPEPKRLYLKYDESRSGGGICESQENESWPYRNHEYIEVSFTSLHRNPPEGQFFYDSFEVSDELYNADQVYMAVVRYTDGDTFGHTCGYWSVEGIFGSRREAERLLTKLEEDAGKPFTLGKYTKAWHGYFTRFERTQIETIEVLEK